MSYTEVTNLKYPISTLLKFQLDIMANAVMHDFDCIIIVDGEIEGSGKSVLAQQVGYYFSHTFKKPFTVDHNIAFTPEEFKRMVLNADKNSAIVWDEAYVGTSKYRVMSKVNQTIQSLLQQIRQKNLIIVIVIPYFFDLSSYIAVPRSWFLLHVYLNPNYDDESDDTPNPLDFDTPMLRRGYYRFYSRKQKKQLYFRGKKEYNYNMAKGAFSGLFFDRYTVDEQEYKKKKSNINLDENERIDERTFAEEALTRGMPVVELRKWCSYSDVHLYRLKKNLQTT